MFIDEFIIIHWQCPNIHDGFFLRSLHDGFDEPNIASRTFKWLVVNRKQKLLFLNHCTGWHLSRNPAT